MKLLKKEKKWLSVKILIALFPLMTISCGSKPIDVRIVKVNDFCERYEPFYLNKADFDIVDKLRASDEKNRMFIDKDIDNRTLNEKEFQECLEQD